LIVDVLKARKAFAEIAAMDETIFALDRAALTLCLEDYPDLNIDEYLRRLDTLAARTEVLIGQDRSVDTATAKSGGDCHPWAESGIDLSWSARNCEWNRQNAISEALFRHTSPCRRIIEPSSDRM